MSSILTASTMIKLIVILAIILFLLFLFALARMGAMSDEAAEEAWWKMQRDKTRHDSKWN